MEKLLAVKKDSQITVLIPEQNDSFETPLKLVRNEDFVSLSPYSGDEEIKGISDLIDALIEVSATDEETFNFDVRMLNSFNYDIEEIAPALHKLSQHAKRLKIDLSEIVDILNTLLKRFSVEYVIEKICNAGYDDLDVLIMSPKTIEAFELL